MYVQIVSDFIFLMYLLYCLPAYILILDFLYMLPISPNFNGCVMPKSVSALLSLYTINFHFLSPRLRGTLLSHYVLQ